jgi:hypothetical protein
MLRLTTPRARFALLIGALLIAFPALPISSAQDGGALPLPPPPAVDATPPVEPAVDNPETAVPEPAVDPNDGVSSTTSFPLTPARLVDDFEDGLGQWLAMDGVTTEADPAGNSYAVMGAGTSITLLSAPTLTHHRVTVWFALDGDAALTLDAGQHLTLNAAGVALVDGDAVTAEAALALTTGTWTRLDLVTDANGVSVLLNDAPVLSVPDGAPLAGLVIASTGADGSALWIDDLLVEDADAAPDVPAETEIPLPPAEPTAAPTDAVDSPDATEEPEPESTEEADESAEPTPEPTDDLTAAQPTPAFDASRLDGVLVAVLTAYQNGGIDAANAEAASYFVPFDNKARVSVVIWPAAGTGAADIEARVRAQYGIIDYVDLGSVEARIPLETIAALSLDPAVGSILILPRVVSSSDVAALEAQIPAAMTRSTRAPAGANYSGGFDIVGAEAWHRAGYRGSGIRIALLDVGFGTAATVNSDISCYRSSSITFAYPAGTGPAAGQSVRGRQMLEVLCDIAPQSDVRLYRVVSDTDLYNAVSLAAQSDVDVIVIGVDLGVHASPGDGTYGRSSTKDPYQALAAARAQGIITVAAAGNSGEAQKAFSYSGGSAAVTIQGFPGDVVNVSWSGWSDASDITMNLSGVGKTARAGGAPPSWQTPIPASCGPAGTLCTVTLTLTSISGAGGPVIVQVQVAGATLNVSNPRRVVSMTGGSFITDVGSIARPADSQDALAVGAVCANTLQNFNGVNYTSRGPIYGSGGTLNPQAAPFSRNVVKPDVAGPAHVNVSSAGVNAGQECASGFGGTQAAAAHTGGIVALMLQNGTMGSFQTPGIAFTSVRDYLQSRSFDLPLTSADGFDMIYGAGMAVLGSPSYDWEAFRLSTAPSLAPTRIPAGMCTGGIIYAGQHNMGAATLDGSLANPFKHPAFAVKQASTAPNRCVIVLPGEYATPIAMTGLANPVTLMGYSSVSAQLTRATTFYVQNLYQGPLIGNDDIYAAGIYVLQQPNSAVYGVTFDEGAVFDSTVVREPQAFVSDQSTGVKFINNTVSGFTSRQTLVEIARSSHGALVQDNTFTGNNNTTSTSMLVLNIDRSGTTGSPVVITGNRIENNRSTVGGYVVNGTIGGLGFNGFHPIVKLYDSTVDVTGNTITNNTAETLFAAATSLGADSPHVVRMFGNLLVNNTSRSDEGQIPGPLVNLFNMQRFYFVNNTVARNDLSASSTNGLIIGRGNDQFADFVEGWTSSGSMSDQTARWDIHNNLIYINRVPAGVVADLDVSAQCKSNNGIAVDGTGATNNWVFRTNVGALVGVDAFGVCVSAFEDLANNNITNLDPYTDATSDSYIVGGRNGIPDTAPAYYALTGYVAGTQGAGTTDLDGVDEGLQGWLQVLFPAFYAGNDIRGVPRVLNGNIDIGAYEKSPFALTQTTFNTTLDEDSGPHAFNLSQYISSGIPPYSVTVTTPLKYYGVFGAPYGDNCDARFTVNARGIRLDQLDPSNVQIVYCPPSNFHTATTNPTFQSLGNVLQFTLKDASGEGIPVTMTFNVTPVNDSPLTTAFQHETIVGLSLPNNFVALRPRVDLTNNFAFSEAGSEIDYDFTYSSLTPSDPNSPLHLRLDASQQAAGLLRFNLSDLPITQAEEVTYTYTVRDRNNNEIVNTLTVKAVAPPQSFELLTPGENAVVPSVTAFTWEESLNAETYSIRATLQGQIADVMLNLTGLTKGADGDNLTCAAGVCTLTLTPAQAISLVPGDYTWTVTATNDGLDVVADEAPRPFSVRAEMLTDGSFENPALTVWLPKGVPGNPGTVCGEPDLAIEGDCVVSLLGAPTAKINVKQRFTTLPPHNIGDKLVLTGFWRDTGSLGGRVDLSITLANGTWIGNPEYIGSGQNVWIPFRIEYTITAPISLVEVKVLHKNGFGRFYVDGLSLTLERNPSFTLLSPVPEADFAVNRTTLEIQTDTLTRYTWTPSPNAPIYFFSLENASTQTKVFDAVPFTAAQDSDALTCYANQCRLTLGDQPLEAGLYYWNVRLPGGFNAVNGPQEFRISSNPEVLAVNGMEIIGTNGVPLGWFTNGPIVGGGAICDSAAQQRFDSYQGNCAWSMSAGSTGALIQTSGGSPHPDMVRDATVTLRANVSGRSLSAGGVVNLVLNYPAGGKVKARIAIPPGTYDYTQFEQALTLIYGPPLNYRVAVRYTGTTGTMWVDNVSVTINK